MDLQNLIVGLGAAIGALYIIARIYVAITPTPDDDKKLEEVGVLLRKIAKIAGLDLKQGRKIKEPQK